jgi:hypothetical protein
MRPRLWTLMTASLALVYALAACSDNSSPPKTDNNAKVEGGTDMPPGDVVPWPEPDLPWWPDVGQPDGPIWPDTYASSAPFGCASDADCFGQKCCPTPWGVKLCAPTCTQ